MPSSLRPNIILFMLIALSLNIILLSGLTITSILPKNSSLTTYDVIDCGDNTGKIHKCIRVDTKAGEINDSAKGATYHVIYGQ